MRARSIAAMIVIGSLVLTGATLHAAEPHVQQHDLGLSPAVLNLLRAEMGAIAGGMQGIPLSLAAADWASILETSEKIRASYIMEQRLTAAQASELDRALPGRFKELDAEFHQRADRLGAAAATRDAELVAFQYSRLLESCVSCHSAYARSRFPGFSSPPRQEHQH